jgi:hypothetical protein
MCKDCRRQFVHDPQHRRIPAETKALIDELLLDRISLADITDHRWSMSELLQYRAWPAR